jgi:hypothetical protein
VLRIAEYLYKIEGKTERERYSHTKRILVSVYDCGIQRGSSVSRLVGVRRAKPSERDNSGSSYKARPRSRGCRVQRLYK